MAQRKKNAKKKKKQQSAKVVTKKKQSKTTKKSSNINNKKTSSVSKKSSGKVGQKKKDSNPIHEKRKVGKNQSKQKNSEIKKKGLSASSIKKKISAKTPEKKLSILEVILLFLKNLWIKISIVTKKIFKHIVIFSKNSWKRFTNFIQSKKKNKQQKIKATSKEKKEIVIRNQENEGLKPKKIKIKWTFFLLLLVIIFVLCMIPYGASIYQSEASGKKLEVPKFMKLKEECCNFKASFSTFRSVWSLEKDLETIINSYQVLDCDGKNYYYDEEGDYTITEYGVINHTFLNEVYITYGKGNSCNIEPAFKRLDMLPNEFSIEDAKKDGNYIIDGEIIYNETAYHDFIEVVKTNVPTVLRIVKTTEAGDIVITDLEYTKDGKYRVSYDATRDRNSKEQNSIIAFKYEHIGIYKNKLYAYNGNSIEHGYYLIDIKDE